MKKYILKSENDTKNLAKQIAKNTKRGDIVTLKGDLGVGKTFFVNCFINYLYKRENRENIVVTSPTFNLVKTYETNNFLIYHFDLYRIKTVEELYELDLDDAFENVSLIEWPEMIFDILPKRAIEINFKLINGIREMEIDNIFL